MEESNLSSILSYLCDPEKFENLKKYLHEVFEYPRKLMIYFLSKMDELLVEDVKLKAKHREFTKMLRKICGKVHAYIEDVERLCSMCNNRRKELIMTEISNQPSGESFDKRDKDKFPQTIDLLTELDLRLRRADKKREEIKQCCESLYGSSSDASASAQTSETYARWWKYGARAAGAAAVVGGIVLSGGAGLLLAGGGAFAGYLVSSELSQQESSLREMKEKIDEIHKKAHQLEGITNTVEMLGDANSLKREREVVLRECPLLTSIEGPMEIMMCILTTKRNFDNQKKHVDRLLKMINEN